MLSTEQLKKVLKNVLRDMSRVIAKKCISDLLKTIKSELPGWLDWVTDKFEELGEWIVTDFKSPEWLTDLLEAVKDLFM